MYKKAHANIRADPSPKQAEEKAASNEGHKRLVFIFRRPLPGTVSILIF